MEKLRPVALLIRDLRRVAGRDKLNAAVPALAKLEKKKIIGV